MAIQVPVLEHDTGAAIRFLDEQHLHLARLVEGSPAPVDLTASASNDSDRWVHDPSQDVYRSLMSSTRLNVTLDGAAAEKLSAMAQRMHVNEGTLARSLLLTAIDEADPDPANIVALLDGIDGAWEDAQVGWQQAQDGQTIPLDQL